MPSNTATSSTTPRDTMTHLDFFKKLKRLNPLEPSLGILGFFLVTVLLICCFFYLDYRSVTRGLRHHGISWSGLVVPSSSELTGGDSGRLGFLDKRGDWCDIFDGNWVWDDNYPLYQSQDCSFIDAGFRCLENGRPDSFYTKWRWQPKYCNLPRFDARLMLEKLRNRRLVFVGDSVGRNQWESLLCMLATAVPDNSSIYEGSISNCTGPPPCWSSERGEVDFKSGYIGLDFPKWKDADVLVLNSGHWWNHEKTIRGGCYFQQGEKVRMEMSVETAYGRSIETLIDWLHTEVNMSKTRVFFRTYAPVHFRGGDWKTGGSCHLEKLPDLGSVLVSPDYRFKLFFDVLSKHSNESQVMNLRLLNVTSMSARRKDGHASLYYLGPGSGPASLHRQDCSHWCLPGVPDSWNELLYTLILKQELVHAQDLTESSQAPFVTT
ncbi:hypothetical protein H0E87_004115 [Populus deltoides]|uniref:Trichome birefringence-like N-terminal domain-containing protein n=1 Tax=Populus deltoides TaxID=3696 RepID=A0A8T2ZDR9_POPDE|nr:hypothetical protein H0E87_004115 [Populus deltoides]